jgi:IS5 family transposase
VWLDYKKTGLVHPLEVTAASVHDVTQVPNLLHGEEETVGGDSGYLGADKREEAVTHNKNGKKSSIKSIADPVRASINPRQARHKSSAASAENHQFDPKLSMFSMPSRGFLGIAKRGARGSESRQPS